MSIVSLEYKNPLNPYILVNAKEIIKPNNNLIKIMYIGICEVFRKLQYSKKVSSKALKGRESRNIFAIYEQEFIIPVDILK